MTPRVLKNKCILGCRSADGIFVPSSRVSSVIWYYTLDILQMQNFCMIISNFCNIELCIILHIIIIIIIIIIVIRNISHYHSPILIINLVHLSPQYVATEHAAVMNLRMFDSLKDFLQISQKVCVYRGSYYCRVLKVNYIFSGPATDMTKASPMVG